ncbi:fused MFS/spermidine synthase [Isosphaeraceae bacterium EP7]
MKGVAGRLLPYALAFSGSLCIMILELVASRLVARHVGASLTVWTSVIGVMLGGICLGNVLGGRLADRVEPSSAVGPIYAISAALTVLCLWVNLAVAWVPDFESLPLFRTIVVVVADFLIPTTVLGMIGPLVAKMAVEQSRKTGSAVGNVYFLGAVGSIVGTFIAGFYLIYLATTTTIVMLVAAGLSILAIGLLKGAAPRLLALATAAVLALGSMQPVTRSLPPLPAPIDFLNPLALVGHVLALLLGIVGLVQLMAARRGYAATQLAEDHFNQGMVADAPMPRLGDLSALSFIASMAFMALEMDAGRMVTRHLGSSIYGWTSVIGVLLGGLSLGNYLGGRIANRITREKQASWLFFVASLMVLSIIVLETPPKRLVWNPIENWFRNQPPDPLFGSVQPVLSRAISMTSFTWPTRVLFVTSLVFLLPAIALGTVSPVVAKLAVDRVRASKRTGAAIGQVYAWGMVGSILGTFLTGFVLIDVLGTKGVILVLAALLAFSATFLGSVLHAAWAGIPLGLCVIAFMPHPWFQAQGVAWGIREEAGKLDTVEDANAYVDESNYYYIKVTNEPDAEGQKRTLVLDNLIHGYFVLDHPERVDYQYEHIYALVSDRVSKSKAKAAGKPAGEVMPLKTMFLGGGAYTFPRYLQHTYHGTEADVAEIDPAVTRANHAALGLPANTPIKTIWGDARTFVERNQTKKQYDIIFGDAFNDFSVPWHLTTLEFNRKLETMLGPDGVYMINIIDMYESDAEAISRAEAEGRSNARRRAVVAVEASAKAKGKTATEDETELARDSAEADPAEVEVLKAKNLKRARSIGGFLAAWVETAKKTFPNVYIYGTDDVPGRGLRETYVVVVSKKPLDLAELGGRDADPRFFHDDKLFEPRPYGPTEMKELEVRSLGIVLTDDYAPVENLLAPVAKTRGEDE